MSLTLVRQAHKRIASQVSKIARDIASFPAIEGNAILHIHLGKLSPRERGLYLWEVGGVCEAMPRFGMMCIQFDTRSASHTGIIEEWHPRPGGADRGRSEPFWDSLVFLSPSSPTPWNRPEGFLGPGVSLYSARLFCRDNAPFMWRYQVQCTLAGRPHYSTHIEASCDMLEDWQNIRATPSYHPLT